MAQTPLYVTGDTQPVNATVATAQAITRGDLTALVSNTLVRAEDIAWDTDLATTQTALATAWLGVAAQSKLATTQDRPYGQTTANTIRVDTAGQYEFDCASATLEVGDFIGAAKQSGNLLESQKVVKVSTIQKAIGVVARRGTSITRVLVKLLGTLVPDARPGAVGATGATGATGS